MSKGPAKGSHGSYIKGNTSVNNSSGTNQRPYYNGTGNSGNNSGGVKHAPSQCRYWRQGTCKLGDSCRFLHEGARPSVPSSSGGSLSGTSGGISSGTLKTSGALRVSGTSNSGLDNSLNASGALSVNSNASNGASSLSTSGAVSEFGEGLTSTAPQERTGRRPFLKVVVLYASDSRVLRYAKDVQTQFLDAGVDVYLQIDLDNASLNGASGGALGSASASLNSSLGVSSAGGKDNEIKTENLAEIITSSTNADFLIVIGDRNMKNQSCQVKKRGKLVEMDVYDMIRAIWNEWAPHQADFEDLDPKLSSSALIERLSMTQLYIILQRFPPQINFEDALKRAREAGDEIKTFGKSTPSNNKTKKQGAFPSLMTSSLLSGSAVILDEKQGAKLQTAQKNLIRLHKQALAVRAHLSELPESKTEETFIINQEQFGHHVGPDYRPQQALIGQISAGLRSRLMDLIAQTVATTEQFGAELAALGAPLWTAYITQVNGMDGDLHSSTSALEPNLASHIANTTSTPNAALLSGRSADGLPEIDPRNSLPTPSPNEWSCLFCTSFNELHLKECKVCGNPRVPNGNSDEGAWETAGEKKARKKREAAAAESAAAAAALATSATPNNYAQTAAPGPRVVPGSSIATPQILTKPVASTAPSNTAQNSVIAPTQQQPQHTTFATTAAAASTVPAPVAVNPPASNVAPPTVASNSSSGAPPKKKLLDPIPGLAAAKQAAKATTATSKDNKPVAAPGTPTQPSTPANAYTSPGSTYSSIVSGTAGSTNTAAFATSAHPSSATQDPAIIFPPIGNLLSTSSPAGDANAEAKSTLNEIFGSGVQQANSAASHAGQTSTQQVVPPSFASSQAALSSSGILPSYVPSNASGASANGSAAPGGNFSLNSLPMPSVIPPPGNNGPYYYGLNGSTELSFPMTAFPPVSKSAPQAPLETPMAELLERWKQQANNGTTPNGVSNNNNNNGAPSSSSSGPAWAPTGSSNSSKPNNNNASVSASGLRTPTKNNVGQASNNNNNAPHTPTFTTPFKGSNNATPASRYGPPPSPMHLPSSSMNHHHHHHHHQQQQHQQQASHHVPLTNLTLSQVMVPIMAHHLEDFVQAEPKIGVKNPCWYCGEEATIECNLCPKVGLETFFCSGQHQAYIWKFHVRTCHPVSPTLAASFEKDSYHPSTQQSYGYDAILPAASHQRRETNYNSIPRYPSPGGRHKYT